MTSIDFYYFPANLFYNSPPSTEENFAITPRNIVTAFPRRRTNENPQYFRRDRTSQLLYEVCGLPVSTNSLILHGTKVAKGAYPWLVAIFHTTDTGLSYKCTAILISKRHVVTGKTKSFFTLLTTTVLPLSAAHCVRQDGKTLQSNRIVLVLGRTNLQHWEVSDGVMIAEAEEVYVHPNYTSHSADADIAVLELRKDIVFSVMIRPICLWEDEDDLDLVVGENGLVVGWGKDEDGVKFSPEPKQIELPIVSQEQCLRSGYAYRDITSDRTFCAGEFSQCGCQSTVFLE